MLEYHALKVFWADKSIKKCASLLLVNFHAFFIQVSLTGNRSLTAPSRTLSFSKFKSAMNISFMHNDQFCVKYPTNI